MKTKRLSIHISEHLYKFLREYAILKFNGNISEAVCYILNSFRIEKNREIQELIIDLILQVEELKNQLSP